MDIAEVLKKYKTIAVVGCSKNPSKDAHTVPRYMQSHGYKIIPINPTAEEILGEKCYSSLLDMPNDVAKEVEIVDVFRPSEDVPAIVDQTIELKKKYDRPYVFWMQYGIENEDAAKKAKEYGLEVVMNRCMMVEYNRL